MDELAEKLDDGKRHGSGHHHHGAKKHWHQNGVPLWVLLLIVVTGVVLWCLDRDKSSRDSKPLDPVDFGNTVRAGLFAAMHEELERSKSRFENLNDGLAENIKELRDHIDKASGVPNTIQSLLDPRLTAIERRLDSIENEQKDTNRELRDIDKSLKDLNSQGGGPSAP